MTRRPKQSTRPECQVRRNQAILRGSGVHVLYFVETRNRPSLQVSLTRVYEHMTRFDSRERTTEQPKVIGYINLLPSAIVPLNSEMTLPTETGCCGYW